MGSPASDIRLSPRLRPWKGAGLTHLFGVRPISAPAPQVSSAVNAQNPSLQTTTSDFSFSAPWDSFWKRTIPGAQVIFTYPSLARDLLGRGDGRHAKLVGEILYHLGWNGKGIGCFWPMNDGADDEAVDAWFWQGIQRLGTKHIVCFGAHGASLLMGQVVSDLGTYSHNDKSIHVLPSMDKLIALLPHERHMAADRLRSIRVRSTQQ